MQPRFPGDYTRLELKINDAFTAYEKDVDEIVAKIEHEECFTGMSDLHCNITKYHLINFLGILYTLQEEEDWPREEYAKVGIDIDPILQGFNFNIPRLPENGLGGWAIGDNYRVGPPTPIRENTILQRVDIHALRAQEDRCFCLWKEDYVITPGFQERYLATSQDILITTANQELIKV